MKVLANDFSVFLAHLSNGVHGSFIPKRYNSSLQLGELKHTWKNIQGTFQGLFPQAYSWCPLCCAQVVQGTPLRPGMTVIRTPLQQSTLGKTIIRTPVVVQQGILPASRFTLIFQFPVWIPWFVSSWIPCVSLCPSARIPRFDAWLMPFSAFGCLGWRLCQCYLSLTLRNVVLNFKSIHLRRKKRKQTWKTLET